MDENLRSDAEIAAVRIGLPDVLDGQVLLVDYDSTWPQLFQLETARIRAALGTQALAVEHVGSTSVPGLAAKPRIDIVLVVADSSDEPTYVTPLVDAGYVLRIREPDWYEHRVFKGPDTDVNLHVFSEGCPEIERMTRFRDHLRSDDADRQPLRADEARPRTTDVEIHAALCRCQGASGRGDPEQGRQTRLTGISAGLARLVRRGCSVQVVLRQMTFGYWSARRAYIA